MNSSFDKYLQPSNCVNSDDERIVEQAHSLIQGLDSDIEQAVALYYFVRDTFYYNPYTASIEVETLKATHVLEAGEGWCVSKAVLLAALCRATGIPARLGFADVINHLSTEKLRESMGTDVFYFHGYCSICLNNQWVKATPAFNLSLCEKFKLQPLEFNGVQDSLYHPFDQGGNRHMEYVRERGEYIDVPIEDMKTVFAEHYPDIEPAPEIGEVRADLTEETITDRWHQEVEEEISP